MRSTTLRLITYAALILLAVAAGMISSQADLPPLGPIPTEASGPQIDPVAATRAYLDTIPAAAKASSDAYFEGGYWLLLWDALISVGISVLVLARGWSAAWRDAVAGRVRWRWAQAAAYGGIFTVVTTLLYFPMFFYEGFIREHRYGMSTQSFGSWTGDQVTALMVQTITTMLGLSVLYLVFRKAPRTWWLWGAGVALVFNAIGIVVAPILIEPLFNQYKPLEDPAIRDPILALARANQIPTDHVYVVDQSRQTTRVSANVAGGFGTARIALNDNLLKRCSLPEIRAVMAHEMGHYVLNHVYKLLLENVVVFLLFAFLTRELFAVALKRWGRAWRVEGISDPAGFPLLVAILTALVLLFTPVNNSLTREVEAEADSFGLNASREPDGFAQAAIKLGQYRKMDPGPLEEFVFFDHPSGRARILKAMQWKAAHLPAGPVP